MEGYLEWYRAVLELRYFMRNSAIWIINQLHREPNAELALYCQSSGYCAERSPIVVRPESNLYMFFPGTVTVDEVIYILPYIT